LAEQIEVQVAVVLVLRKRVRSFNKTIGQWLDSVSLVVPA